MRARPARSTLKKRSAFIIIAILALAILTAAGARILSRRSKSGSRRPGVAIVRVEPPVRQTVTYTLEAAGDIVAQQQANLVAKVSGSLGEVNVNLGARVGSGQLLAVIDAPELAQQVEQAGAMFLTAEAEYNRSRQLLEQKLLSQQDFENAAAALKVADANYQTARTRLGYTNIVAPFAGTITRRYFDPGAIVTANATTLFTLMDLDRLKVVINVLEKDVPLIVLGARARVTADALPDDTLEAEIGRLSQAVDPATRTMPVEVFVTNRNPRLKPGMYATVSLTLAEHPDALTVPIQAVLSDDQGRFVYVADDKTARRVPVTTGIEQDARLEITSGLTGSEQVITIGQQYVRAGGEVKVDAGGGQNSDGARPDRPRRE